MLKIQNRILFQTKKKNRYKDENFKENKLEKIINLEKTEKNFKFLISFKNLKNINFKKRFVIFYTKTTGLNFKNDRLTEIGAVEIVNKDVLFAHNVIKNITNLI